MAYLIFDTKTELTKIGESNNPKKRLYSLKTSNPNLVLVYYQKDLNEKELHKKYYLKRVFREWFKLTINDYIEIIGDDTKIDKSILFKYGLPKFIAVKSKVAELDIDFILKDFPNYGVSQDKNLYNLKNGRKMKLTLNGLKAGFWLNRKFIFLTDIYEYSNYLQNKRLFERLP